MSRFHPVDRQTGYLLPLSVESSLPALYPTLVTPTGKFNVFNTQHDVY